MLGVVGVGDLSCGDQGLEGDDPQPLALEAAITSPVRPRSKASGLTRIRVRLTAGLLCSLVGVDGSSAAGRFADACRDVALGGFSAAGGRFFAAFRRLLAGGGPFRRSVGSRSRSRSGAPALVALGAALAFLRAPALARERVSQ